ncbi:hypothetical protein [Morganella morganii]
MTNKEKIENFEKISYIVPFSDKDDNKAPLTSIAVSPDAKCIDLKFHVGLVGLKPNYNYQFKIFVIPIDISVQTGESKTFIDPLAEAYSVRMTTPRVHGKYLEGEFDVDMDEIPLTACGIYQVNSFLYDFDLNDNEIEIHSLSTFFVIKSKPNE